MTRTPETLPFVLEVPILEDAAVDALHTFLLDLLTQFEKHYFAQLHRYQQDREDMRPQRPEKRRGSRVSASRNADGGDDAINFDDQIPF